MPLRKRAVFVTVGLLAAATMLSAQRGGRGVYGIRRPGPNSFKGSSTFCRLAVGAASDGDGGGWGVDDPRADENLSIRLSELRKAAVNMDEAGTPQYVVIQATDPELFQCPFIAATNPGRAFLAEDEAVREGDDPTYFYKFSVEVYAIGIDVLLYILTH